ncbi:MAG TPA: FCD domain-containing protein, partial [Bradyrhizobium sp.]|nr:FCD domain-containing protein [Bradyrhizobium sp.]
AHRHAGRIRDAIRTSGGFHILLGELSDNPILGRLVRQLVARTSLVVSLYENQNTMSCWHDDHGQFIKHLETHAVTPAVTFMRKHLQHVEESLNLGKRKPSRFDLRAIYAPDGLS